MLSELGIGRRESPKHVKRMLIVLVHAVHAMRGPPHKLENNPKGSFIIPRNLQEEGLNWRQAEMIGSP